MWLTFNFSLETYLPSHLLQELFPGWFFIFFDQLLLQDTVSAFVSYIVSSGGAPF